MNPHSYAHLSFDQGTKNIWWRKNSLFNNVVGKSGFLPAKTETRSMFITLY
jgi:L,D-peptidoglycan transpeptidase YkuD (ErfK/YbiS/YcfS/YnhG family)